MFKRIHISEVQGKNLRRDGKIMFRIHQVTEAKVSRRMKSVYKTK